jgi:hypothetical protein
MEPFYERSIRHEAVICCAHNAAAALHSETDKRSNTCNPSFPDLTHPQRTHDQVADKMRNGCILHRLLGAA